MTDQVVSSIYILCLRVVSTTNSLGFEINGHDTLGAEVALDKILECLVSLAAIIIVLHVVHAGKLSLGNKCVSLRSSILISGTDDHREDIRLAVLEMVSIVRYNRRLGKIHPLLSGIELVVLVQQLSLVVLAGEFEHGDSVHTVGHLDSGGLCEGSRYATETGTGTGTGTEMEAWDDSFGRES